MSRIQIVHDTIYRYRTPVTFGPHRLVLRPREGHDVDVAAMNLDVQPAFSVRWSRDVFGNSIAMLELEAPADILHIRSEVLLDRAADSDAPHDHVRAEAYPVVYPELEASMTPPYLAPSFPADREAVQRFVLETLAVRSTGDVAEVLPRLNSEIHRRFRYQRREQKGVQTPAETLALEMGSCRDLATVFMECARVLGIAARFVSGYLDCTASEAGRAATHAWAEAYLPENGWCGFDPTIGETTSHKHVVVGVSNHPRGVMPVSGKFTGATGAYLGLEVAVKIAKV